MNLSPITNGPSATRRTEYVWRPQAGPQKALVDCPLSEVFFGGSRGGGKTDGVLGKWALKEKKYGRHFNARMFRKTTVSSEDAIERAKEIYLPLGAKFNETKSAFRMPNGGRVAFGYLDHISDADAQQGKNLTDAWIEEAGQYSSPVVIDKLFGALRSAHGVPVQMILTANPGGAGQSWIRERYQLHPFPRMPKIVTRELGNGALHKMAVIPSRITDNRVLMESDPNYVNRLHLVGSEQLVRAWLEGDWTAVEGAFFDEWNEAKHVIEPFTIPPDWMRFRSMDWGSAKPFSVGWWAVVPDDFVVNAAGSRGGRAGAAGRSNSDPRRLGPGGVSEGGEGLSVLPRGALVRYREWYGMAPGKPNVGLKLTANEVARGVKSREGEEQIAYGVLDPAAFAVDGGPSIAERMANEGVHWRPADNKRVAQRGAMGGWDTMRARLKGQDGVPMLYVFSTCRDFIRTVPVLQHDPDRSEDLDTDAEDHVADEARYGCMSRPWVPAEKAPAKTTGGGYRSTQRSESSSWRV